MPTTNSTIMRRVYLSYTLSYGEQPLLWCGLVLGGATALFGRWTHVASIAENVLATPLGSVPTYLVSSFMAAVAKGELGTVLLVLVIAVTVSVTLHQWYRFYQSMPTLSLVRPS
jgi:hypothetical protein